MTHDRVRNNSAVVDDHPVELHVSSALPCPYIDGQMERKLIAELSGPRAKSLYDRLSRAGFRRSHRIAYTTACPHCQACVSVRIRAQEFMPSRNMRRIGRVNQDLSMEITRPQATEEQYHLFNRYVQARHESGSMSDMRPSEYRQMIEDTTIATRLALFRNLSGQLLAGCLFDLLDDGYSAVYSFFDPEHERRSLGTMMVLALIDLARQNDLPYVYLGYWVKNSRKMGYKTRFAPLDALWRGHWYPLRSTEDAP